MAQMGRLKKPADEVYFDALCTFHELGGDLDASLEARQHQAALLAGRGQAATECLCALHRVGLLARLGRPVDAAAAEVRAAAARLRKPAFYLDRLERVRRGEPPD
jgi:hypothetical protein